MTTDDTTARTATGRGLNIVLWTLQIVLGLFYLVASAGPKLVGHESAAEGFDLIGWGDWFMYTIGAVEALGGIGLLIPRVAGLAAAGLGLLMVGATIFNATVLDYPVYTPIILLVLVAFIAWGRRDRTRELFTSRA